MSETKEEVVKCNIETFIEMGKLHVNKENIKYMVVSRKPSNIDCQSFFRVNCTFMFIFFIKISRKIPPRSEILSNSMELNT